MVMEPIIRMTRPHGWYYTLLVKHSTEVSKTGGEN